MLPDKEGSAGPSGSCRLLPALDWKAVRPAGWFRCHALCYV